MTEVIAQILLTTVFAGILSGGVGLLSFLLSTITDVYIFKKISSGSFIFAAMCLGVLLIVIGVLAISTIWVHGLKAEGA